MVILGVIGPRSVVEDSRLFEFGAGNFCGNRSKGFVIGSRLFEFGAAYSLCNRFEGFF